MRVGENQIEELRSAISRFNRQKYLVTLRLGVLRSCVQPTHSRQFQGFPPHHRAQIAAAALACIITDTAGLLKEINQIRRVAKDFIAEANDPEPSRVLLGG